MWIANKWEFQIEITIYKNTINMQSNTSQILTMLLYAQKIKPST
jgi:hypothetical protein